MMLRRPLFASRPRLVRLHPGRSARRWYANEPDPTQASRVARIESRLPKFLHRFTTPLRQAPVSHITAFLILHELTAVVPLLSLVAFFHYTNWLPPYVTEGAWVRAGTEKFGRWLRKRGWMEEDGQRLKWWDRGEGSIRLAVEWATAYAITKALLPLRIPLSIWFTPTFARWSVLPVTRWLKRRFGKAKASKPTAPVTTGTTPVQSAKTPPSGQGK